ncbi:MAG: 50S ribosomal protein L6 [Candidatus Kapaibacteriota bacterium]|jgi:large subunit ribosomal protein L6
MSRVGNKPITIPNGVSVTFANGLCTVKGPKGTLTYEMNTNITPNQDGDTITFVRANDAKDVRAMHGTTRARIAWMVEGVSKGFERTLQIEGVGYKVEMRGKNLMLSLGYSHPIMFLPPDGIEFAVSSPTVMMVKGIDKQLVGQVAAKLREQRKPEPYKGKGVRYQGEYIRRKAGKSAGK